MVSQTKARQKISLPNPLQTKNPQVLMTRGFEYYIVPRATFLVGQNCAAHTSKTPYPISMYKDIANSMNPVALVALF